MGSIHKALPTRLIRRTEGSVGIIFALTIIPVVGLAGAATDYASAITLRQKLQEVVDSAAIAGARVPSPANRLNEAERMFAANLSALRLTGVTHSIHADNNEVRVAASMASPNKFLQIVGKDSFTVATSTTARAQLPSSDVACLLALNPSVLGGLHLQGVNRLTAENCWAWVNSSHVDAIHAVGASQASALGFCTVGGVAGPSHFTPRPNTQCAPMADPFATQFENYSTPTACTYTNLTLGRGNHTLQPGVYCGTTTFRPHANVTFAPGLYVIRDGNLEFWAQSTATGTGVTFFFRGSNTKIDVRSGSSINFSAPTSGPLAGFVMVDRKLGESDTTIRESIIRGGGSVRIEGIVYAPRWKLVVSGNSDMNQNARYTGLIVDQVWMEGNARIHIKANAAAAGMPQKLPPVSNGVQLLH